MKNHLRIIVFPKRNKFFSSYLRAAVFAVFLFSSSLTIAQSEPLVFTPQWFPQAQFAGYYIAKDQGFYKEAGLNVMIQHPTANTNAVQMLKNGTSDVVSSFLMDGISQRMQGTPVVNIAQLSQHSSMMIVAKKSSGVDSFSKLDNKSLAIWSSGFDKLPKALINKHDIDVQFVPILNTINLFLVDGVDAMAVMYYNEYDQIINSGINNDELYTYFLRDYEGYDIPEDGIYCLESTYNKRKADLQKFVKATMRGWDYAAENKENTLDLVVEKMNRAHLPNNRAHQRWMLNKVLELLDPGNKNVTKGHLLEQDFHDATKVILEQSDDEDLKKDIQFKEFYKPLSK